MYVNINLINIKIYSINISKFSIEEYRKWAFLDQDGFGANLTTPSSSACGKAPLEIALLIGSR